MSGSLLTAEQRDQLQNLKEHAAAPVFRRCAEILLLYDDELPTRQIAETVELSARQVRRRRSQFLSKGMQMFPDDIQDIEEIVAETEAEPVKQELEVIEEELPTISQPAPYSLKDFMAEAKGIKKPGINRDDTLAEAGRKILRYQFAVMILNEKGTRLGEDIEALHDMRVATRRMRAALDLFGDAFSPKITKTLLKGLRATGKRLGNVRDQDVFIDNARQYLLTVPEDHRAGLDPLIASWEDARQKHRQTMLAHLDSKSYRAFKEYLMEFVITPGAGAIALPNDLFTPKLVREIAPQMIYSCFGDVRAFEPLLNTATIEQFHSLRIAFKKFRYAIEFFQEVLGDEVKLVIGDLKKIQDHLGNLNDAQVATLILRDFLGEWDSQQQALPVVERSSPEPIMAYLSTVYNQRQHLMDTFRSTWDYFNRPEFRQNLAASVATL